VDDASALAGVLEVSRETLDRLERFVELVKKWQRAENLIAPASVSEIWRRHVADSAQLTALFPQARVWVDLGSGGGFPGMVTAILMPPNHGEVHLVESNQRKSAFLRAAIRETGAPAFVHLGRIEEVVKDFDFVPDTVSARALAALTDLLWLAEPLLAKGARGAFHKGQDFAREISEASKSWAFDLIQHKSRIDPAGVILEISRLARLTGPGPRGTS
jgi:16S rRNA (guanine527-N7)-methyltransferase